jgi:yecA family protein
MSADLEMPEFDDLASVFWSLGALQSPSQVQGYLAGELAVGGHVETDEWLQQACSIMEAVDEPSGEAARLLLTMHASTVAQLKSGEMDFQLILPEDPVSLMERTACLGQWCQGFLAGFAYAGKQQQSEKGDRQYSKDVSEALTDLAAISQISMEDEEFSDGQETDYFEVVEYVRLAVINIFLDCNQSSQAGVAETSNNEEADSIGSASNLFNNKLH